MHKNISKSITRERERVSDGQTKYLWRKLEATLLFCSIFKHAHRFIVVGICDVLHTYSLTYLAEGVVVYLVPFIYCSYLFSAFALALAPVN